MSSIAFFVGIDVAKDSLEIALRPSGESFSLANREAAFPELIARLQALPVERIIIEATGGYETLLVSSLVMANLPVCVVNPRQARYFAQATNQHAKSDRVDARMLAQMGEQLKPEIRPLGDEKQQELAALLGRRQQLVEMLTMEKNRLQQVRSGKQLRKQLKEHIEWLEKQLRDSEAELQREVEKSEVWRVKEDVLKSVPGVGAVCTWVMLAKVPELGRLSGKQIAALVGVAPFQKQSGKREGARHIRGGRAEVRAVLYMAALTGIRCNRVLKEFYERLLKAGKKKKVALTACMRKLLTMLNAMVKNGEKWREV